MGLAGWPWGGKQPEKSAAGEIFPGQAPETIWKWSREAEFYQRLDDNRVVCSTCPNACVLKPGDRSVCRSKVNHQGTLTSLAYGNPCAVHIDPVEKKPLFHFKPGSRSFSIAAAGCNLRCLNCQNWEISQARPEEVRTFELFPDQVVEEALQSGSSSIAYTYSEPVTFMEYMLDTARAANEEGLSNLLISNGYVNTKPLLELCRHIQGANINLKSYSEDLYQRLNGGHLQPVLKTFKTLHDQGVHVEITNLVVPGYTDEMEMIKRMCDWILNTLGPHSPLHFLRFFPMYKLQRLSPTPVSFLRQCMETARHMGIHHVYVGNAPVPGGQDTLCPGCSELLIQRQGYHIPIMKLENGRCPKCRTPVSGVWS
jgi:pyruvate formate lyase activating enzyme